jgi:hypothetical protein
MSSRSGRSFPEPSIVSFISAICSVATIEASLNAQRLVAVSITPCGACGDGGRTSRSLYERANGYNTMQSRSSCQPAPNNPPSCITSNTCLLMLPRCPSRSSCSPFFLGHWSIADDVLAEHMLDVLHIAPAIWIAVLQPNKSSSDIGRQMFGVMNDNRLLRTSWHEDLARIIVIAVGALVERALNNATALRSNGRIR